MGNRIDPRWFSRAVVLECPECGAPSEDVGSGVFRCAGYGEHEFRPEGG